MTTTKWAVIGRGFNGWHAKGDGVSSSGGTLDGHTYWTGAKVAGYAAEAVEGALVYDAENAEPNAFVSLVMNGPMVNPAIPPDAVHAFDQRGRESLARMAPALGGGYKTLAIAAQDDKFTGLDSVGVAVYERLLRKVPGVKIGKVSNGAVIWEA